MIEAGLCIGVDFGGTKTEAVLIELEESGSMLELHRERIPTKREDGYEAIVERTAQLIERMVAAAETSELSIGVGMPGSLIAETGCVKNSNTVCLNGRPFHGDLKHRIGRHVAFENDANCFALAETKLGAAKAYADGVVFGVIMGTGVGGGLVLHGKPWSGRHHIAGEWGHHAVFHGEGELCYCGKRGCMEASASGPAIENRYLALSGQHKSLVEIAQLRESDAHAAVAIESLLEAFGRGLANVINILDPSAIVLGGGVSNLDVLYTEGVERVAAYVFNDRLTTPILKHTLGDSAGVLGAALLHG